MYAQRMPSRADVNLVRFALDIGFSAEVVPLAIPATMGNACSGICKSTRAACTCISVKQHERKAQYLAKWSNTNKKHHIPVLAFVT